MRPKKLVILFLVVAFTVLQSTLLNSIRIFRLLPDILLILVVFYALYYGPVYGLSVGALCAIFAEATSGVPAGVFLFSYSLSGLLLGYLARLLDSRTVLAQITLGLGFSLFVYSLVFSLLRINNLDFPAFTVLLSTVLPACLYTACFVPILFPILQITVNIR